MSVVRKGGNVTIGEAVLSFYRTKKISHLFAALNRTLQQRRLIEVCSGVFCFLAKKPSKVYSDMNFYFNNALEKANILFAEMDAQRAMILSEISSQLNRNENPLRCTIHGFVMTENGFVVGEYAIAEENTSMIFVKNNDDYVNHKFYGSDRGVWHIHSILKHDGYAFISTGDSNKYLDKYRIVNGDLFFDSRILRHLGGFLACCEVDGMCFFGSDFSERPNYIFCLETRRKFFFPRPAYYLICVLMLPLYDRYIFCLNRSLRIFSHRKAISIFDIKRSSFIYCKEYSEVRGSGGIFDTRIVDDLI